MEENIKKEEELRFVLAAISRFDKSLNTPYKIFIRVWAYQLGFTRFSHNKEFTEFLSKISLLDFVTKYSKGELSQVEELLSILKSIEEREEDNKKRGELNYDDYTKYFKK